MNPHRTVKLATTNLSTDMQRQVNDIWNVFSEEYLESLKRNGQVLEKSKKLSNEARTGGNNLYKKIKENNSSGYHSEILSQYSKSIAFAPIGSEELVLGYGNRSALLMYLRRYKEALIDVERALKLSKSDDYKKKIQDRKEKCIELINEEKLMESTKSLTLKKKRESLATKLMSFERSATVPCAADCVNLAYNQTFGRHLVAARDINPGEILIVEQGYACYPLLNHIYLVCSHCFQFAWNGIPCDGCVYAIYCSENCKKEALDEYHDIECPMVKYMDSTVFQSPESACDRMVTIRILIKAIRKEGYENVINKASKNDNKENFDALLSDGILQSNEFKSCYNLLPHSKEYKPKNKKEDELRILQIIYLLIKHTDFPIIIGSNSGPDVTVDPHSLFKIKEILTKLRDIGRANGFSFADSTLGDKVIRGSGIVPCCCLCNHSCAPNVSHSFTPKRKVIVFSTCPIKKGEMLCDSYGVSLLESDFETRQKYLRFACQCKGCLEKIGTPRNQIFVIFKTNLTQVLKNFEKFLPKATNFFQNSFLKDPLCMPYEDCELSNEDLQFVIQISQFLYKHLDYYESFIYNYKCRAYIEKMMLKLYGEKRAVLPNNS